MAVPITRPVRRLHIRGRTFKRLVPGLVIPKCRVDPNIATWHMACLSSFASKAASLQVGIVSRFNKDHRVRNSVIVFVADLAGRDNVHLDR